MMKNISTGARLVVFLAFTFIVTYALEFFVIGGAANDPALAPFATLLVGSVMFIPALGVVFTRLVTREGFKDAWIAPNFKGHIRYYVLAWLLPAALILAGAALYFAVKPEMFDPGMGHLAKTYAEQGIDFDSAAIQSTILLSLATTAVFSPVLNILHTTGEEWGWRGYLLPKLMERFSVAPAVLLSGVIWGLWHAPLIAIIGHNYGFGYPGYPYTGILAMVAFCVVTGTFLSYVALRTRSCLPAAIAHGALNGMTPVGVMFLSVTQAEERFVGPMPVGIIGGAGFIVAMVVFGVIMLRLQKKQALVAPPKFAPPAAGSADEAGKASEAE